MADWRSSTIATTSPTPVVRTGEVLIKVAAAGVNNTDVNTRIGWYSKTVGDATGTGGADGFDTTDDADASWMGVPLHFPRIQGADCCGRIVAAGEGVDRSRIGERVIVRSMMRAADGHPFECRTFGSECDGAFAQYARAPARETYKVECDWSDEELASIPCAYSTAENLLHRAAVGGGARARHRGFGRGRIGRGSTCETPRRPRHRRREHREGRCRARSRRGRGRGPKRRPCHRGRT